MKHFINFVFRYFLPILGISLALLRFFFPDFIIYFYGWAYLNWILAAIILLIIILSFNGWYSSGRERFKEFKKNFPVYRPISELEPSDFGIFTYYDTYIYRESDTEAEKSLTEKGIAFITGKPGIGKTRGAFELAKKFKDYYLLKPAYEKIEIQNLKFPQLFSQKKIILFLDDLEKYAGKFGLDELIAVLRRNSKELKILATCRTGKEFDQAFGKKEMGVLLSQCKTNKVEPRILDEKEERELAKGIGKKWEEVASDGTPGSIVLGLDQMEKRYKDLENEPKTILHILKLLREANIFLWTEELLKNIAKSRIFELKGERYQWDNWLKDLQKNDFIQRYDGFISISHDSYLDNKFITDYPISDSILTELKEELFVLKDAENLFYLGLSFYNRENLNESIDCYKNSIKINPNNAEVHNNLGILLKDLKNYTEAEREYRTAINLNPDDAYAHNNLGNLLRNLKNYSEAEKEFRTAINLNPDDAYAHNNLGILLYNLENYTEAEQEYRTAVKLDPNNAEVHYNLGILLKDLNYYPKAEKEYRTAIKLNPDYVDAHVNLGILLHDLKSYMEAEKEYRTAIKINPNSVEAHINMGALFHTLKNYPEAEKEYQYVLKLNPDLAEAYANLGFLYIDMGNKEGAKKGLQKAKELFVKQDREGDVRKAEDILKGLESE